MLQLSALLALVPLVAAHGFVQNASIGGKEYDVSRILHTQEPTWYFMDRTNADRVIVLSCT